MQKEEKRGVNRTRVEGRVELRERKRRIRGKREMGRVELGKAYTCNS